MIDHVIFGTRDLDAAGHRLWEEFGLASYDGGVHPLFGTGNRIVPLGDSYIEVMGVVDIGVAQDNPLGRFLLAQTEEGDRWIAWCVRPDDLSLETIAERIGSVVVPGHRDRPDGVRVSWRLTGLEIALNAGPLPFFITWDDPSSHPGRDPLQHRAEAGGIQKIELACDASALAEHLDGEQLPLAVRDGSDGILAVTLATPAGPLRVT